MNMSQQQLFKLVNGSTFTFIGTIKELGSSNVSGIEAKDSLIVQVESVEPSDQPALKKLGDLKGSRLTVAVNPISGIGRQKNISAVFFADPLVYEKNIGVTATAVPIPDSKEAFLNKLHSAALQKSEAPLRAEVKDADLIIVGEVEAVGPLSSSISCGCGVREKRLGGSFRTPSAMGGRYHQSNPAGSTSRSRNRILYP